MDRIALIGYRGSGKSTVGPLLAEYLGWEFDDTDTAAEFIAGMTVREMFAKGGEEFFRVHETAALEGSIQSDRRVIATGGGIVTRAENLELLKTCFVIWLDTPAEVCWDRIRTDVRRPKLTVGGFEEVRTLIDQRQPLYEAAADLRVDGSQNPRDIVGTFLTFHKPLITGCSHLPPRRKSHGGNE